MRIVDGGYLAWQYGTTPNMHNGWVIGRIPYMRKKGTLILLDSKGSLRKKFYPLYKSKRATKREDPVKMEKYRQVQRFINEFIIPDHTLETVAITGLEADDLVAMIIAWHLLPLPIHITGIDKDLLQLPRGSSVVEQTQNRSTIEHYASKLPKAVQPYITEPHHVLLSLAILGDSSDSVPRLLPPRDFTLFRKIMEDKSPFYAAYAEWGDTFLTNLYITVLPAPWCYNPVPDPMQVLEAVSDGTWYALSRNEVIENNLVVAINNVKKEVPDEPDW